MERIQKGGRGGSRMRTEEKLWALRFISIFWFTCDYAVAQGCAPMSYTPCGTRTRNLRIRSPTPCPLGQGGLLTHEYCNSHQSKSILPIVKQIFGIWVEVAWRIRIHFCWMRYERKTHHVVCASFQLLLQFHMDTMFVIYFINGMVSYAFVANQNIKTKPIFQIQLDHYNI